MKKVFNLKENKHLKKAEISIETILIVVLGMMVIFVVFNMFYSSLFKMSTSTKMKSVYEEKSVEEANANNTTNYMDPNSQVSVQVMADPDADIEAYHTGSIDAMTSIINSYSGGNIGLSITENDKRNLAQQVTLFAMSGANPSAPPNYVLAELNTSAPDIASFILGGNISITLIENRFFSTFYGTKYDWYNPNLKDLYGSLEAKNRLKILEDISIKFY